ncbi:hypothetical protein FOQG_16868 [Fusarium oxysporum f. sp. raphani 54005]|uniref:Uncharacterized protein n=1 Tax=Fusarium oxysporum f. sp. raphani 54005 TaxID=1089458 RepID=X0BJ14_FUSOX|nr:hypothetical protein FOQG_16868 [Fusarium oxysporum f. sp. raphani 54005]
MSIHIGDYEIHHSKIHADGFLTLGLPVLYVADPRTPRNLCLREWPLAGGAKTVSLEASQHSNTQANSEPPSDLDEQLESVLAVGGHNLASGGREVNGS